MKFRIALILLVITLLVIVPAYAQDATPEATAVATLEATQAGIANAPLAAVQAATVEATSTVEATATLEAVAPSAEATATLEAVAITTNETSVTLEAAQPETHPVAGVPESSESENAFPGATVLVLLIGLGAVGVVGFAALMRENFKPPQE